MAINIATLKPASIKAKEVATEEYVDTKVSNIDFSGSINSNYEIEIAKITALVPASEVTTWPKQESEARAYLLNNESHTPLIYSIAEERKCTKDYLVEKIIEKADAYAIAVGTLTGVRQKLEKEILGE